MDDNVIPRAPMSQPLKAGKRKAKINKSTKTVIEFDHQKRKDFLTGFRKRKEERRKKAREQIEREMKEEIKKAKESAKDRFSKSVGKGQGDLMDSQEVLDDIEKNLPSEVREVGGKTVSVSTLPFDLNQLRFGFKPMTEDNSDDEAEEEKEKTSQTTTLRGKDKKAMNKIVQKKVAKSKAFKKTVQLSGAKKPRRETVKSKKTAKSKRDKHHHPKKIKA